MATPVEKAKCVLWLESTQSVSTVQRRYQAQYGKTPPSRASVYAWYKKFSETGCLCPKSRAASVSEETAERVKSAFSAFPDMSTRRASRELGVPPAAIQKIMHREPRVRRYHFEVRAPLDEDVSRRQLFLDHVPTPTDTWLDKVVFSGEMDFYVSGEVSREDLGVFGSAKTRPPPSDPDADKLTVFCALSKSKVFGPFFVDEPPDTFYQRLFEESLVPQLDGTSDAAVLQVDVPATRFNDGLRHLLETRLPERWIGPVSDAFPPWPRRSPELSPLDFFLWGFVRDDVFDAGAAASVAELRHRVARALSAVPDALLAHAWQKLAAHYDACRANHGHRPH